MRTYWSTKNVFVTGATGLVGSALAERLVREGANVICLIRDMVPKSRLYLSGCYQTVTIVNGCLEDYNVIERALNEYEVDTVFHLGAQTIVGTANRSPLGTFESNIKGTWNILEACRRSPLIAKVIVASSDKAYGSHERLPYTEETPLTGMHPYDCSKSCADLLAQMYYQTYKLPVGIARCGNFFGGGDLNFNRVVPGTIRSVLHDENPIIRSDGQYIRDYIYILDAVEAYLCLGQKLDDEAIQGHAFNFSNESHYTVLDMVNLILKLMKRDDLKPVILNTAKAEIRNQYLSAEKAARVLSWRSKYTIEEGLVETIAWYRNFFDGRNAAPDTPAGAIPVASSPQQP